MPENPTTPSSTPPVTPKAKRKAPAPINRKYLDEITLIRKLIPAAQKPERAAILTAGEWTATRITALSARADTLENAGLAAVGRTKAREMDTSEEETARATLLAALTPIRVGAKRKYRNGPDAAIGRHTYYVNEPTSVSLERLLFIAGSVLLKLVPQPPAIVPDETLPGVTAAIITNLQTTRAAYVASDIDQSETDSDRRQAQAALAAAYTDAQHERIDLQLAADQGWDYHDPFNGPARRDFQIPADRPMTE